MTRTVLDVIRLVCGIFKKVLSLAGEEIFTTYTVKRHV